MKRMLARPEIERFPDFKAATVGELGVAYSELPTGDRGANLQRAIVCYEQALTIYTPEAHPVLKSLINLAETNGFTLRGLTVEGATLEDVFIQLTGRRIRA